MKISLNWLKDFIDITEKDNEKIKEIITANSAEIETMERQGNHLKNIVVGKVIELNKHPNADKLQLVTVTDGEEKYRVVCGGSNLKEGMLCAFAKIGAVVRWHGSEVMKLEKAKIRGEESFGMICSSEEIGLEEIFPKKHEHEIVDLSSLDLKLGAPLADALELNDVILDVDNHAITNRSDLFSHRGFAREFVTNGLAKWKTPIRSTTGPTIGSTTGSPAPINLTIKDKDVCSHYMGVYMTGIEIAESPDWMKKRLSACGIRPISNIVDITNYVMLELGMPLHTFDLDKVKGEKWVMRKSKMGEKVVTLDEQEHELPADSIILDDGHEIFDLCGIMGGYTSGISQHTKKIWLHSPVYHPILIRRAMRTLGHISEAGIIYEKGIDNKLAQDGLERAVELILEICPNARVASQVVDIQNYQPETRIIDLKYMEVTKLIGNEVKEKEIEKILTNLGFTLKRNKDGYAVTAPSWRLNDVFRPADVIEEIARIHGYDNIPFISPLIESKPIPINHKRVLKRTLKQKLVALGCNELCTFSFLGPELLKKTEMKTNPDMIEITNPISNDMSLMRQSLLPRTLETVADNLRYQMQFRLFELSRIYFKKGNDHEEKYQLIIASAGESFRELQGIVEQLNIRVEPSKEKTCIPYHHPGRVGELIVNRQSIGVGYIYELHPQIKKNFDIKTNVVIAEIDVEILHKLNILKPPRYQKLPKFPSIKLDVSIAIPKKDLASKYFKVIEKTDKTLISQIDLIDEYIGDKIEKNKRAITYSITYQAPDRTLTDEEVNAIHLKVVQNLQTDGAVIR